MSASAPPQLEGRRKAVDGSGRIDRTASPPIIASEAKAAILAEMRELDRPVTSKELYALLDRAWSLKAIEYHLSTLVKTKVVRIVFGPELHFSLTEHGTEGSTRGRRR
jgi:hypothetical protein